MLDEELDTPDAVEAGSEPVPVDEGRLASLAEALQESFGMSPEDAAEIARTVLEQFGGEGEVNDETLDPSVRSIFYTLEAKKLLSFRREEYTWETGERRRGFWWRIRDEALVKAVTLTPQVPEEDVYAALPKDAWTMRQQA